MVENHTHHYLHPLYIFQVDYDKEDFCPFIRVKDFCPYVMKPS